MMPDDFKQEEVEGRLGCRAEVVVKNNLQEEKSLHGIKAKIVIRVKDEKGNLISKKELPANSFVINFMKMLYAVFRATSIQAFNINGDVVNMALTRVEVKKTYKVEFHEIEKEVQYAGFQAWARKEDDSHGIMVGSGTASVTANDYKLDSKIPHGIGSGKIMYLSCDVSTTNVVGNSAYIEIKRSFINYSGSDLNLTEIGLAVKQFSPETYFLVIRDLIEATTVPNNYGVDVSYIIEVSV